MSKPSDDLLSDPLLLGVPLIEGFRVLDPAVFYARVGAGGMGTVYRGRHFSLGCDVAVKVLKADLAQDQMFVARFEREAQLAARIKNDNVVQVLDVRQKNGVHYLVMEFVKGETARERVLRKGPLPEAEAVAILVRACRGMRAAHAAGIVHRDFKPDNVLVSADGAVKVADLGLAKSKRDSGEHSGATLSSGVMGTPQFMPPEQWLSPDVTPAADVWSLGATLWYLLVGRNAIEGGTDFAIGQRIRDHEFPNLRDVRPDVRSSVVELVTKCTQRDPEHRFANAGELLRVLQPLGVDDDEVLIDAEAGTGKTRTATVTPPSRSIIASIRIKSQATNAEPDPLRTRLWSGPRPDPRQGAPLQSDEVGVKSRVWLQAFAALTLVAGLTTAAIAFAGRRSSSADPNAGETRNDAPTPVSNEAKARAALQQGLAALSLGDLESAITEFERALQLEPALAEAKTNLVLALTRRAEQLEANDLDAAYGRLDGVQQLAPDDAAAQEVRQRVVAALRQRLADGVSLTQPAADAVCGNRTVGVQGVATAPHLATVRIAIDGRPEAASLPFPREQCETVTVGDGRFAGTVVAPGDGRLLVRIALEDTHGIAAELAGRFVLVDTGDPELTVETPEAEALVPAAVTFAGTASDPTLDTVTVGGLPATVTSDGKWSRQVTLPDGLQEIEVIARDRAGNTRERRRKVLVDGTAPVLRWLAPLAPTVQPGDTSVSVAVTDASRCEVFVNGDPAVPDGDNWRATVRVGDGEYSVTVTARDAVGNTAEPLSKTLVGDENAAISSWATAAPGAEKVGIAGVSYPRIVVERQTGMRMLLIPANPGGFDMGSPDSEPRRRPDEVLHRCTIRAAFWLGETEATQEQWQKIMGVNPSQFLGKDNPVEKVSWADGKEFVKKLNALGGGGFRLPSEGEWEYACRAGKQTPFSFGVNISTAQVNYDGNFPYLDARVGEYREKTAPVRSFAANAFGLYEMHGNVYEWCEDAYAPYPRSGTEQPAGAAAAAGAARVMRGGYWGGAAEFCRSASREKVSPVARLPYHGFRLARTLQ